MSSQIKVELQDIMGNDRSIAESAWTSSLARESKVKRSDEDVKRVINLLADQKHCFDEETEILTKYEWKFFKDLLPSDLVASVQKQTHNIEWVQPLEIIKSNYNGDMYSVDSSMVNFKVTPNHDLYVSPKKNSEWLLPEKYKPTELSIGPKKVYSSASESLDEINDIEFFKGCLYGFFIGDGFWDTKKSIGFRLKKRRKIEYIKNVLFQLDYKYSIKYVLNEVTQFSISSDLFIDTFGKEKSGNKFIKREFFDKNSSFKLGIIDGLKNSDGCIKRSAWFFSTTSKQLNLDFQTLCASLGKVVKINKGKEKNDVHSEQYRLMVLSRSTTPLFNDSRLNNKMKIEKYDGNIYCVTVPNGLILTRRHNCQMISGNSVPFESVIFRWHLEIPIAIDRQLMTHRLQSASGMSARYRRMPSSYLDVPEDVMDIYNKISSDETDQMLESYYGICDRANAFYQNECAAMKAAAEDPLRPMITNDEYKRVREFLRGVLPQHNMTERVSIMNLRSWSNFYKLRSDVHAQKEIQLVAKLMLQAVKESKKIPFALEALERNGWVI